VRTLGIDLASRPDKTGVCVLRWGEDEAVPERLEVGAADDALAALAGDVDAVGIDAPFGWPVDFADLVAGRMAAGPWSTALRDRLRFRRTDAHVRARTGRWPLSVSSDLIAVPAMRCVLLLERLGVTDRSGDGRVFETYPAAALSRWGLTARGYKGRDGAAKREALVEALTRAAPWLRLSSAERARCVAEDDALDALVASLLARAAACGLTEPPPPEHRAAARTEGWIHLPTGLLADLAP
jgi:predicted nuclease with RNAse H fold